MTKSYTIIIIFFISLVYGLLSNGLEGESNCDHKTNPAKLLDTHILNPTFLKKVLKHLIPFSSSRPVQMHYYLYKRDFPNCGRQMRTNDDGASIQDSAFNVDHPTRIIIHGWMSESKGKFNRITKDAYMNLTKSLSLAATTRTRNEPGNVGQETLASSNVTTQRQDYNVIVVDWSVISSNINYFEVVDLVEDLGFLLAEFLRFLHNRFGLCMDNVYLIGHSLGAQIAGSAGKQLQPLRINTIYALDAAGPKFQHTDDSKRLDKSDADYVESIQTSTNFGFRTPIGHAAFYPNFGRNQKSCYTYGCSHSRAYQYFAESITSELGFWGVPCEKLSNNKIRLLTESNIMARMGGEPSIRKEGTFYVKTNNKAPYAMGPIIHNPNADLAITAMPFNDSNEIL